MSAASGDEALDVLRRVVLRDEEVTLLLADQRMQGMTGVEFLARAIAIAPAAKRVLLTAYADTEAAIRAINELDLDHYPMKPWHPPEERLYPALDDLLGN
jgi:thioredoxin reductase (NADPH)